MSATPAPQPGSSGSSGSAAQTSAVSIPQTAPAGGLTITQPPQTATSFYKIAPGNTITFGWNFTSLLLTPSHLTVSAICDNGNTYPVGPTDGVLPGNARSVEWDLWSYQQANPATPLAINTYQLHIWDDQGPGAPIAPGRFHENDALRFALYSPQPYTPLASWSCPTCNSGAWSLNPTNPVFISLLTTFLVMFLSGYALLRQAAH